MIARLLPGVRIYPSVERGRWYPVLGQHPDMPELGFYIPTLGGFMDTFGANRRFVFAKHFEVREGPAPAIDRGK
jgi:hypothetical protein